MGSEDLRADGGIGGGSRSVVWLLKGFSLMLKSALKNITISARGVSKLFLIRRL